MGIIKENRESKKGCHKHVHLHEWNWKLDNDYDGQVRRTAPDAIMNYDLGRSQVTILLEKRNSNVSKNPLYRFPN